MKTQDVIALAKEYRRIADEKLDHKDLCKGFSETARAKGIDWTQLKKLVDAQAADARDGKHRVGAIVEKADFASAYAEMLAGHSNEDERISRSRSSDRRDPSSISIAAGSNAGVHS
jgi:hypothetical protein